MIFRCCIFGLSSLVALGVICSRQDQLVSDSAPPSLKTSEPTFLVKPYLQLGNVAPERLGHDLTLLWHAADAEAAWVVEYQTALEAAWGLARPPTSRRIAVPGIAAHRVFQAILADLVPGKEFGYRVRRNEEIVFTAVAHAPKEPGQPFRFVSFGDCGAGTAQQKLVAYQTFLARPDFLIITGDIVYSRGRISEYLANFWPAYNADHAAPLVGAPLLRSTLFVAAPGNHDIATRDLAKYPDGLAYFLYWDQPHNGPLVAAAGLPVPPLIGPEANQQAFIKAAGDSYPRMASFSFEYGNSHWTVLDSNPYVDWTSPELRAWVERDLANARASTWRFVAFHHPGFNSSKAHLGDQQMRLLAEVFEAGQVDVVFSGHVHNYQRTYPLRFTTEKGKDGKPIRDQNKVPGRWSLDKVFDGRLQTQPQGVIYIITGAGGNTLYNPEQQDNPGSWQPFTFKFVSMTHTFTVADIVGNTLTVRQVSAEGMELDRFTVTK
jgi:acid phosphatase type 7